MSKEGENRVIEVLAKRFILSFEKANDLYIAYRLAGSGDSGVACVAKMYELSPEVVRAVFRVAGQSRPGGSRDLSGM